MSDPTPATAFTATPPTPSPAPAPSRQPKAPRHPLLQILDAVASLRLTVMLFALSLVLVFYGTWAQKELGTWTAVNSYFRSAVAHIPLKVLLFYTIDEAKLPAITVPYPGGWLLGGVLLANVVAAHIVRFRLNWRRSGVLILHAGLICLMIGELITGLYAIEGHMSIRVGGSSNFVEHNDRPEIAFVKKLDNTNEEVVAVPGRILMNAVRKGDAIVRHPDLPVDVHVKSFMKNSKIAENKDNKLENLATKGEGKDLIVVDSPEGAGAASSNVDIPSAYVSFLDRKTGNNLGTWLMSLWVNDNQAVTVDGTTYEVAMRFKRSYKPYTITLNDFQHKKFVGANIPKDFRAFIDLKDEETKTELKGIQVYMNNPFTYRGETFYQSSVLGQDQGTVFQVVRNPGWVLPYLGCILVSLGMLAHFGITLSSFVSAVLKKGNAALREAENKIPPTGPSTDSDKLRLAIQRK